MSNLTSLSSYAGALALTLATMGCVEAAPGPEQAPEQLGTAESALAIAGLFSTGVNALGVPLAIGVVDPHYALTSTDPGFPGPNAVTVVPAGGWTGNTATSKWISIQPSTTGLANAAYTYTTTFPLAGVNPASATVSGKWSCDDSCALLLNGSQVAVNSAPAWGAVASFTVPAGSPFVVGTNTLAVVVTNTTGGPTGAQIISVSGNVNGCTLDAQCSATQFCNTQTATCTPKLANGTPVPTVTGHAPPLTGVCNPAAGAAVCTSGVCDLKDNDCGYASGDGPCATGNGNVVCRSGVCSVNLTCMQSGGCNADGDCSGGKWCNESTHVCTAKFVNGSLMPTDSVHANPTLDGTCSAGAATLVCVSGVCDTDKRCGYADGDGPCVMGVSALCRSGVCSVNLTCEPMGGCNADGDCAGGTWCDESTHTCSPQLANGGAIPVDGPHTGPTLNGTCSAAAATLVCVSGACDTKDNLCGYAYGDGPCTIADGPTVCRLGGCSPNALVCVPSGGCAVDADCAADQFCNTPMFICSPKVPNGQPVPTVAGHSPALTGACTAAAGAAACASAVCDTADNLCGYANGDGPCAAGPDPKCRSGACSVNSTCMPLGGCNVDGDCNAATQFCDTGAHTCATKVANGSPVPTVAGHTPALDGVCSTAEATVACQSGVCDTKDNLCGYANGDGPCTGADGAAVCRSGICATTGPTAGTCAGCIMDSQCSGATPVCNTTTSTCVQCTKSAACAGATPVCDPATSTCAPCDGDFGSGTKDACGTASEPLCFLGGAMQGQCGKCATDADCKGHPGTTCDTSSGTCVVACHVDTDCASTEWCNAPPGGTGTCTGKLDNGTALPATPASVATCSASVGTRVCKSGVCDTKDNTCGFKPCDGPCSSEGQCRQGTCDLTARICSPKGCATDAECPDGHYCKSGGSCAPKLPDGQACDAGDHQCKSGSCDSKVCSGFVASGNGLICAATPGGSGGDGAFGLIGLMLAAAGLARRRR